MLKNIVRLEHTIADKSFHFLSDHDASTTAIKEALCQFLKFVGQIEDQAKAYQEQQKAENPVAEQSVPDIQPEEPKVEAV